MKKATKLIVCFFAVLMGITQITLAQVTIADDDATDGVYSDGWTSADDGGTGFDAWTFSTSGSGGSYIGTTGQGADSFGLFAGGNGGSDFSSASRSFTLGDMLPGYTFSIDLGHSTTIENGGSVGINLKDGGSTVFTLKFVGGSANWVLNDGGSDFSAGQSYDDFASLAFTFTYEGDNKYSYTFGSGSGSSFTAGNTISGIDSFELFSDDQGSGANFGANNLDLSGGSLRVTGSAGYRLLSTPTSATYTSFLSPIWTQGAMTGADVTNGDPNVFTWNNSSSDGSSTNWNGVTDLSGSTTAGQGFLVYVFADDDYDGSADAFPKTLSVSGTQNAEDTAPTLNANNDAYSLAGNPFATTIDFDNVTRSDLTNVAYVWDPNSSSWKTYETAGGMGDLTDGLISPFQGFFVQNVSSVSDNELTFGAASKSSGGTFQGKAVNASSHLRLYVEGNGVSNSIWIRLSEAGSFYDKVMGDANELQPLSMTYAQLAIQKKGELLDIAHINTHETVSLPIEFNSTMGGEFRLSATDFAISEDVEVMFHDYQEGISIRVDDSFSYTFETAKLKAQNIKPLSIVRTEVLQAKATDGSRFGITVTPTTAVSNEPGEVVERFALDQNYPNPFNPSTTINYSVENTGQVSLSVYNVMGQKVAELVNGTKAAGSYNVSWNASGAASGMYYYRLEAGGQVLTRKMTLIK